VLEAEIYGGCVGAIDTECGGGKLTNQTVRAGHIFPSYWNDQTQPHDTLLARDYKGVGNQDLTSGRLLVPAIPIHDQATRNAGKRGDKQDGKGNGLGVGKPGDPCPTLTKGDKHAIAFTSEQEAIPFRDPSPTLTSKMQGQAGWAPYNEDAHLVGAVAVDTYNHALQEKAVPIRSTASDICHTGGVINPADRMAVRRLTPRECERLQGFPDDHTLIPWRNKQADQCPDGPRYKALGNSMAVPCMAWIGKRIARVENERQGAA
jgi:DNA (cytosine-5)-methyltransferase 1